MKFPDETAKPRLIKQALWQINLPTQCYIPCPKFNVLACNAAQQAAFFLPHDKLPCARKVYKYVLSIVNVASRFKEAEPMTSKDSADVAKVFKTIYKHSPLTWPQMLQVDPRPRVHG